MLYISCISFYCACAFKHAISFDFHNYYYSSPTWRDSVVNWFVNIRLNIDQLEALALCTYEQIARRTLLFNVIAQHLRRAKNPPFFFLKFFLRFNV